MSAASVKRVPASEELATDGNAPRFNSNTVSLDDSIDMLRIIPISIRRYMSGITTVRQYGTEDGTTMQEGKSVTYQSITSAQNILHLASLVAPGWGLLEGDEWKAAVDRDTCVVDRFAATGYGSVSSIRALN